MRGQDVEAEIALTLEEAHRGVKRSITLQTMETAPIVEAPASKDNEVCPTCRGAGVIRRPKSLEVTIPAGVRDGSVIRLAGQGEPGSNGAPAGDLFLRVRIQPHRLFNVVGDRRCSDRAAGGAMGSGAGGEDTGADARRAGGNENPGRRPGRPEAKTARPGTESDEAADAATST